GVYGVSVKVYQGNNRTDIIVKHIDSKQEKHFIYLIYDNVEIITEGDGRLDLLLSYKGNQICVQCKDRENALILSILKEFESTMTHFKNSLGIL
ncbi:26471_t:CDS:2, partial [Racocetra persica]